MNQNTYRYQRSGKSAIPDVIFILLILNVLVFALQFMFSPTVNIYFSLWPLSSDEFYPWQLLSYGFLHGNLTHILFNMFMLWMFGRELEMLMGPQRFLVYYLTCVIGAGIVQLIVAQFTGTEYRTVGASGGVFGILLAFGMTFPNRMIILLIPPIPMRAKYMVVLFGLLELYLGVSGNAPGIANFAHLGGMLFGFLLLQYWARSRRR